ncbi:MAG: dTDP-4-dehydrorhamnose reductase [Halanaerobiales bacterium]|nr:dTDP-4-dehydrorhamnose reductase [Halanaerobiales bacterium]
MGKILISGADGQLGRTLSEVFQDENVYAWGRTMLDFTDPLTTLKKIKRLKPEVIIHAGAYTDVKGCELNPNKAFLVNALGTRNIAIAALEVNAKVVYISTDYVFDGSKQEPYIEFDTLNPLNIYGKSKLAGEEIIQSLLQKFYILRTSWIFSEYGRNFVKVMLELAKERHKITVIRDQIGTPTYARDLAVAIKEVIQYPFYGIYHISNKGSCSWFEFAKAIFHMKELDSTIKPITTEEYGDIVKRPQYTVMENFNFEKTYNLAMRDWRFALKDCLQNSANSS